MTAMRMLSIRIPADLVDRLDEKARDRGKTRSELIRDGLEMYWRHPQGSDANADAFMEMQGHWMQEKARTDRLKELAKCVLRQLNDVMNWYHEPLRDGGGDTGSYLVQSHPGAGSRHRERPAQGRGGRERR